MSRRLLLPTLVIAGACLLVHVSPGVAQFLVPQERLDKAWNDAANANAATLLTATTPADKRKVYAQIVRAALQSIEIQADRDSDEYRLALSKLVAELPDSATAQTLNASLTNPGTNQVLERSGLTELFALAADAKQVFAANDTAVTVNLNAIALLGAPKAGTRSAQFIYTRHEGLRRLGGSFTFGAKLPEKEFTGISGVPSADKLLDAVAWDIKLRIVGDRDARASKWHRLYLGQLGTATEAAARFATLSQVQAADAGIVAAAADDVLGELVTAARRAVAQSLQVSAKFAGQHLTTEAGKNKYSAAVMLDKGFAALDFTANLLYSSADASAPAAIDPFKTKDLQLSAGLTGSVLKNTIVRNRAVELSASFSGKFPVDDDAVPVPRRRLLKGNATIAFPFQLNGRIPVSITYSDDPANLVKEKYVSGQIGLSWDFGAIWNVFK